MIGKMSPRNPKKKRVKMTKNMKKNSDWTYTFDGKTHSEYIQVKGDNSGCETVVIRDGLNIDINSDGEIVGIEILGEL